MTRRVLFLGCHCDDVELGCGALVHKLSGAWEVHSLTLARSVAGGRHRDRLMAVQARSLGRLGVRHSDTLDFPTCSFHRHRQAIWEALRDAGQRVRPQAVFTQAADEHQDHGVLYDETLRAFRGVTLLAYRVLPSCPLFAADCFEEVSREDVDAKLDGLREYDGVFPDKDYLRPDVVEADLRLNGLRIGVPYAEGFRAVCLKNVFAAAGAAPPRPLGRGAADETVREFPAIRVPSGNGALPARNGTDGPLDSEAVQAKGRPRPKKALPEGG
jgi:LmbE family N-acetylglucosaminyl deacetylase